MLTYQQCLEALFNFGLKFLQFLAGIVIIGLIVWLIVELIKKIGKGPMNAPGNFWHVLHFMETTKKFPAEIEHCFNCKYRDRQECPWNLFIKENSPPSGLIARYCSVYKFDEQKEKLEIGQTKFAALKPKVLKAFFKSLDYLHKKIGFLPLAKTKRQKRR